MLTLYIKANPKYARFKDESTSVSGALLARTMFVYGITDENREQVLNNGLTVQCSDGSVHIMFGDCRIMGTACLAKVVRAKHTIGGSFVESVEKIMIRYDADRIVANAPCNLKVLAILPDRKEKLECLVDDCNRQQLQVSFAKGIDFSLAVTVAASVAQFVKLSSGEPPLEIWYLGGGEILVDRRIFEASIKRDSIKLHFKDNMELSPSRMGVAQAMQDAIKISDSNVSGVLESELLLTQLAKSLDCFRDYCGETTSLHMLDYKKLVKTGENISSKVLDGILTQLMPELGGYQQERISNWALHMRNTYIHSGLQTWLYAMRGGFSCRELNEILMKIIKKLAYVTWGSTASKFTLIGGD